MHSVPSNAVDVSVNILAGAIRSARKNARKSNIRLRNAIPKNYIRLRNARQDARRAEAHENNRESRSRRTDKQRVAMKDLVDRVDWAHCLQCNHNNWDDCVQYAIEAAEHNVIGCEYLKFNDKNDSRDGTVPSPT